MINASEARAISMNYYKDTANSHLSAIEKYIKAVAERGGTACAYANDVKSVTPKVEEIIISTLREAGYKVEWGTNRVYLHISWSEQKEEKANG